MHENIKTFMDGFRYDAHPMSMLASTVAALSSFYPEAKNVKSKEIRRIQMMRLIAKMPTLAAFSYRHSQGLPYVYPNNDLGYVENFLTMMKSIGTHHWKAHPALVKALDILFILHADHEQNCSTTSMRMVGSSEVDPYSAVAAGITALYGPLHGGANEAVLRMLREIGDKSNIPDFIKRVKGGDGTKLMGFGHRVYKNYDPRAKVIKKACDEVFEVTGKNPLLEIAVELERIALQDEYFVKRKLYPNVDFYSGLIYEAMGFPVDFFTVLFAIPRTVGWVSAVGGDDHRPRAEDRPPASGLRGPKRRDYVAMEKRPSARRLAGVRRRPGDRRPTGPSPRSGWAGPPVGRSARSAIRGGAGRALLAYSASMTRAYFCSQTLRRTLSVGVSSPPSMVKSWGSTSKRLMVSKRASFGFTSRSMRLRAGTA